MARPLRILLTFLVAVIARAADPVIYEVTSTQDGLLPGTEVPGQPGVFPPVSGSLRWAIHQANQTAAGTEVIVRLQADTTYPIERSTVWNGINTENDAALDPSHGDLEITRSLTLEGQGATIDAQHWARIFEITGSIQVTIQDVTLKRGGHAALQVSDALNGGGALRISGGAQVDLRNLRLEDNVISTGDTGEYRGGAILVTDNAGGRLDIRDSHFENNRVHASLYGHVPVAGGALYHDSGPLFIQNTTFLRCWAMQDSAGPLAACEARGGALCLAGGSVEILDSLFEENSARSARGRDSISPAGVSDGFAAEGGAIEVRSGVTSFWVKDTKLKRNTAKSGRGGADTTIAPAVARNGGPARGGAVSIAPGASLLARFHRCQFEDNIAFAGPGGNSRIQAGTGGLAEGGAIVTRRGTLDLLDSQFLGNLAVAGNGGLVSANEAPTAKGGRGGPASGGAVHASHETEGATVTGTPLQFPAPSDADQTLFASALFEGNHAVGGNGQKGYGNVNDDGKGGAAEGGAIAVWAPGIHLANVLARHNTAQGGNGGDGAGERYGNAYLSDRDGNPILNDAGQPIRITDEPSSEPGVLVSGRGGNNGNGAGGFLATHAGLTTVHDSALVRNQAVGGRLAGRLYHRVSSENNGVWHLQRLDASPPFVAGIGGFRFDWQGARGGDGGRGDGGAIHAIGAGRLEISGSGLTFNEARGGNAGPGKALEGSLESGDQRGGDGGAGGYATGGGVHLSGLMTFRIESSSLFGNLAIAGRGGNGGRGRNTTARVGNPLGGLGGSGGGGGGASGGGLYSDISVADATLDAAVVGTYAAQNKVAGGDGGLGASGGEGWGSTGGHGGDGGQGGRAWGGALDVASLYLERSTLDRNLVSSGWGGAGGLGNAGNVVGGFGRPGGEGGPAAGGGLAISANSSSGVRVVRSTVSYNQLFSGNGGNGGFGGVGGQQGGDGATGGANGLTRGGGIYNQAGAAKLVVVNSTIAGNVLNAGGGGLRGLRGAPIAYFNPATVPTAYRAGTPPLVLLNNLLQPGPPIREGSAAFLQEVKGFQLGTAPPRPDGLPLVASMDFESPDAPPRRFTIPQVSEETGEISHYAVSASAVAVVTASTVTGAVVGAIYTGAFTGSVVIGGGAAISTTTLGAVAAGGALAASGGFVVGTVAILWVAPVALFTVAMIDTGGDFEASAAFVMGAWPEEYRGVNPLLLRGNMFEDEDDGGGEVEPQWGQFGQSGVYRLPEGTGIWGGGTLSGTLVANNSAVRRTRPTTETILTVGDGQGGQTERRVLEYTEIESPVDGQFDVVGTYTSQGANFVSSVNHHSVFGPVFPYLSSDFVGGPGAELDAKIAPQIGDYGGDVPTLKLLPGSPARGAAVQGDSAGQSQNGYTWAAGAPRDIGAWGGPPNRAPVALDRNFRLVQGSGEKVHFSGSELLDQQFDPDGNNELIGYTFTERIQGDGDWLVIGFAGDPPGFGVHQFTPTPAYVGYKDLYRFRITDGGLESNTGTLTLQVMPAEDPDRCPEWDSGRIILINNQPSTASPAAHVALPDSAKSDHNFTGPFTVELWFNLFRTGGVWAHEHEALITKGDSAWRVQRAGNTSRLAFDVTGLSPLSLYSQREIGAGWHHVAVVYDGSRKLLYVDGVLDAWTEVTGTPAVNDQPVWIGANSEYPNRNFMGAVDEVRVWNYARSAAEIRDHVARTLTGFESGLLTYYRFDELTGDVVLNLGMSGTSQPGIAVRQDPDKIPDRYTFGVSRVGGPILWEFGTTVLGRQVFYNDSVFDGNDPAANGADDQAIAPQKRALLPGEKATAAHYTSYAKGLNGVMIDVARLRLPGGVSAADFVFTTGNDNDPDDWSPANPPSSVLVRPGEGVCGSDRITLVWDAYGSGSPQEAVGQGWLKVRLLANERTGLLIDDEFFFGNAIGESDDADLTTSAPDALRALNHLTTTADLSHPLDYNRDGLVAAQDALLVLNHIWTGFRLPDLRPWGEAGGAPAWTGPTEPVLLAEARRLVREALVAGRFVQWLGVHQMELDRLRLEYRLPLTRAARLLVAPTPNGPWTAVPEGHLIGDDEGIGSVTLEAAADQPLGFFRIELISDFESSPVDPAGLSVPHLSETD